VPLYHLTIRAAVLLFPLFCAKSIFAQDLPPNNDRHSYAVQTRVTVESKHHRCFEQPQGKLEAKHRLPASARPETYLPPTEKWHYKYIQGIGENVQFDEYVARYKDHLLSVDETDLLARADANPARFPVTPEKMELYVVASPSPKVRFKDLEAIVVSQVVRDQVKFSHRIEFAPATQATTLARIDIQIPCETCAPDGQIAPSLAYPLFIRVSKPSGWIVYTS
jgi:hypothetical protein